MGEEEMASALEQIQRGVVTAVVLPGVNVGDEDMKQLREALRGNKRIVSLALSGNNISDEGAWLIADMLEEPTSKLRNVNLWRNQVGDVGAQRIAQALSTNRTLTTINLTGNKCTDVGILALAKALETNDSVTSIQWLGNEITDETKAIIKARIQANQDA